MAVQVSTSAAESAIRLGTPVVPLVWYTRLIRSAGTLALLPKGGALLDRRPELVLGAERQPRQLGQTGGRRAGARLAELAGVERRDLQQTSRLALPGLLCEGPDLRRGSRLDLAVPDPVAVAVVAGEPHAWSHPERTLSAP